MITFDFDDDELQRLWKKFKSLPDKVKGKILVHGAKRGATEVVGHLKKPGGPLNAPSGYSKNSLHTRTNRLKGTVFSKVKPQGGELVVSFGSSVKYAKVHETGAIIKPKNKPFLAFPITKRVAIKSRKLGGKQRTKKVTSWVYTKKPVKIPARRPFGRTIEDPKVQQDFVNIMAKTVVADIEKELGK